MSHYTHLTTFERENILCVRAEDKSILLMVNIGPIRRKSIFHSLSKVLFSSSTGSSFSISFCMSCLSRMAMIFAINRRTASARTCQVRY